MELLQHCIHVFREHIAQLIQGGHRVIDNPVYLGDLGAVMTSAEAEELQQIMEETSVCILASQEGRGWGERKRSEGRVF